MKNPCCEIDIAGYERAIKQFRHPNTLFALAAYENFKANCWDKNHSIVEIIQVIGEGERLGKLVGRAYGYDTKHFNNPVTCEELVRPGEWLRARIGLL